MTPVTFANTVFSDGRRITGAITSGSAWEIWMQVELYLLLQGQGLQCAREVPYPAPQQRKALDLLAKDQNGFLAIELKVESAHNAATGLLNKVIQDAYKVQSFMPPQRGAPIQRWAVGLAYSDRARQDFIKYRDQSGPNVYYAEHAYPAGNGALGILIITF